MFNEYIILAKLCQEYENYTQKSKARKFIMPNTKSLPKAVYNGRVLLCNRRGGLGPSFLVQFPFYMTDLCSDDLFFSFTAAQGLADKRINNILMGDDAAWGVGPGCTPDNGYEVYHVNDNKSFVAAPRIIAGFIPVHPPAAKDIYERFKNPQNHMKTKFGTLLPRYTTKDPHWRPTRLAGVDFSCMLFGMAALHPKLGMKFFKEKTRFTFNQ